MKKAKNVSFWVRRIYYDMFANGTKHEELRALTPYWLKILNPFLPCQILKKYPFLQGWLHTHIKPSSQSLHLQPQIAVIHTPGQPALRFKVADIWIDEPESVLGRELSEQGKKDIPTKLCIVTKMGDRI